LGDGPTTKVRRDCVSEVVRLLFGMPDQRYYEALLQIPAADVPEDYTVARRKFEITRHGGMVGFKIGPVEGGDGETATVLLSSGTAAKVITVLEVILVNLGR
jgi:hypothetical protein